MALDPFKKKVVSVDQPSRLASAVTPHDTNDLTMVARALYVGTQGDVSVILADDKTDTPIVFVGMIGFNPIMIKRVLATNTDATDIVALY